MRRYTSLLMAAALLCTGCQSDETDSVSSTDTSNATVEAAATNEAATVEAAATNEPAAPDSVPATEEAEQTTHAPDTSEAPVEVDLVFEAGVWLAGVDEIPVAYVFIGEDGKSGSSTDLETGEELSFTYKIGVNEFTVSCGDNVTTYPITGGDQSMFTFANGDTEVTMRCKYTATEDFSFYTNEQLCILALNYYTAQTGSTPTSAEALSNSDNTVTIHLYDNMDDHIATAAWYTVDRLTAEGTEDILGEAVDLDA